MRRFFVLFGGMPTSHQRPFDVLATPPRVLWASFYPFAAGEVAGPFWTESTLLLLVVQGQGVIQIGPKRFDLSSGQIVHVPWSSPHQLAADRANPFTMLSVHLSYEPWSSTASDTAHTQIGNIDLARTTYQAPFHAQQFTVPFVVNLPFDSKLSEIASDIAHTYETGTTDAMAEMREARLRGLALIFAAELCSSTRADARQFQLRANAAQVRLVREIASFMQARLASPQLMQRTVLAKRAGVSETTLAEAFRAVVGQSPIDYLIGLRINQARRLLRTSRAKVGEIAAQVGAPNIYYFSRLFKKRVGCSPLQYRTRLKI